MSVYKVYCIGLTGHIASGKSIVAGFFAAFGIDIINADALAKSLTTPKKPAFQAIAHHFGPSVLTPEGEINRRQLRSIIFNNEKERHWLEALLHPLIRALIKEALQKVKSPYCVIEIPLLTDRDSYPYLDRVLLVQADREQQLNRCATRDKSAQEDALIILKTQLKAHPLTPLADDIIINTGSLAELKEKVTVLHLTYLKAVKTRV